MSAAKKARPNEDAHETPSSHSDSSSSSSHHLPALSAFPVSLDGVDDETVRLLRTAEQSGGKAAADAARRSTFPFLQADDAAAVQRYSPVYAAAQMFYAQACLDEAEVVTADASLEDRLALVAEGFRAVDLALLRAGVEQWSAVAAPLLERALCVSDRLEAQGDTDRAAEPAAADAPRDVPLPAQWLPGESSCAPIPRVDARQLSVEEFQRLYMEPSGGEPAQPVILQHGMEAWPALRRWADMGYIKRVAAARLVPVETYDARDATQTYLTDSWEQAVMSVGDFIDRYVLKSAPTEHGAEAGYLAQHPLFDQIPALKRDIQVPPYCAAWTQQDANAPASVETHREPLRSAWLGPEGTVSPLHNDPYHNILCQVVGSKYLRLYPLSETGSLYAREGPVCNNSYVDIDAVDTDRFPRFPSARGFQCVLRPGEMLYIPRHYWHYVRSLETSFSVSFW